MKQLLSPVLQSKISSISIRMLLDEPFLGHLLVSMRKYASQTDLPVIIFAGMDEYPGLAVHESFAKLPATIQYNSLKHEVLHLLFGHHVARPGFTDTALFDLAADLCVGQYIAGPESLPTGFLPHRSAAAYYRQLSGLPREQIQMLLEETEIDRRKHLFWASESLPANVHNAYLARHHQWIEQAQQNARVAAPSELTDSLLALTELRRPAAHLPGGMNWAALLRRFANSANRTYTSHTNSRASKRYHTTPGLKVRHRHRILVALDTSGSIKVEDLRRFFREIRNIWRNGAEVYILESDYRIRSRYWYRGQVPEGVAGRAGTDFNDCLNWANHNFRPDALVYFTDGLAAAPTIKPRCPVLWLISPQGIDEGQGAWNLLPGSKVKMTA